MPNATERALALLIAAGLAATAVGCSGGPDSASGTDAAARSGAVSDEVSAEGASSPRMSTAEFEVKGMTCGGCAVATEMAVKKLDGIESADAEYLGDGEKGRCTVIFDPSTVDTDRIASAIRDAGYEPSLVRQSAGS